MHENSQLCMEVKYSIQASTWGIVHPLCIVVMEMSEKYSVQTSTWGWQWMFWKYSIRDWIKTRVWKAMSELSHLSWRFQIFW